MVDDDVKVVSVVDKKKSNRLIILLSVCLVMCFFVGLSQVYDKGVYDGMTRFCDEDIGFDSVSESYVCYDESEYNEEVMNSRYEKLPEFIDVSGGLE